MACAPTAPGITPAAAAPTVAASPTQTPPSPTPASAGTATIFTPVSPTRLTGTILDVAASARTLTLQSANTAIIVAIDDRTQVRLANGGPGAFSDLRPRVQVEVVGRPGLSGYLAEEITITAGP